MATQLTQVTFPNGDYIKDTNTWRGIQDNLTSSTNTTESLSAKQGYLLANGSARDNTKLPLAGGTMTGQIVLADNGYKTSNTAGYSVDKYGNFQHLSATTTDNWQLKSNNGTVKFAVYWETGDFTAAGTITAAKIIGVNEADLKWGGKNFSGSYGCIDAALMDELGANRFQFIKASAITVEYSRDGGSTWVDYGATDAQKQQIFAQGGSLVIGKADSTNKATEHPGQYQLRVTIDTGAANVYTVLNKFVIYVSSVGSANCACKIQKALQSTPTTFVDHTDWISIGGWSGYNVLNTSGLGTYGNTASSQYGRVRFIFKDGEGGNTNYNGLTIFQIKGFGGVGWSTPSTMAKTGHIYSYDQNQNATFPGNITATKFIGALQGNADTATKANILNGFNNGGAGNITWGNQTGTGIWYNNDANGGSVGFRTNNPTSGQVSMIIDGTVYIKEGAQDVAAAVKSFSVSGQTVTYTNLWGGTGTFSTQDTKNTAGSTDTSSKIFLIGATSQAANPQTYSQDTAYVGTDGCLYSGGTKVLTAHQDISGKADKATTLAGYGITDAKIASGVITLGSNTITPLTSSSTLNAAKLSGTIPSSCYTDTNDAVTQTPTDSTDAAYELLFSGSANNTESTERARKSQYATFNPSKQAFTFGTRLSGSTVGTNSYAEGKDVTASGYYSHAEGNGTVASGSQGHAEGYMTIANGVNTHAEGFETTVSGTCSHAEGERTIANHASQHVFGEYNIPDPSTATASRRGNYVEIVGNGDVSDPSNARTLDWDGNETLAGSLNINGGNVNLGTSSSDSDDSGDIAFFYGNGQEKARIYAADEFTSYDSLNYRCYKKDGTYLGTTKLFTTMGGTMGGKITFNQSTKNAIAYQGTKATYDLIKFIDNTADAMGNGIAIGGGGQTIIGGGESADTMIAQAGTSGEENMWIGNDGAVHIFSNLQSGWSSRKIFIFGTNGGLTVPAGISCGGSVAASVSSGEVQLLASTNGKTCYLFHNGTNMGLYSNNSGGAIIIKNHSSNQLTINGATYSVSNSANFRSAIGAAASSSRITKKDIKDITDDEARKILKVDVKSFKYKDAFINKQDIQRDKYYGVIAEDVLKTIPYVVNVPQDYDESKVDPEKGLAQDLLTIDYDKFVPYLIKMIQLQQKEIEELKAKI